MISPWENTNDQPNAILSAQVRSNESGHAPGAQPKSDLQPYLLELQNRSHETQKRLDELKKRVCTDQETRPAPPKPPILRNIQNTNDSYQNLNEYKEEILSQESHRSNKQDNWKNEKYQKKESYYEQIKRQNDDLIDSHRDRRNAKRQELEL